MDAVFKAARQKVKTAPSSVYPHYLVFRLYALTPNIGEDFERRDFATG